ncbi:uncharacterized protein LOC131670143 [Phymastichus coffea]|uniref:uncharacterized protein LOC131670143 n=1 Tax=Phymastichus coffea TaxID=108790 RepID=UPI00273BF8DE|nr:uncharacterized protein LOC131670143 [Phymastichus coffea]
MERVWRRVKSASCRAGTKIVSLNDSQLTQQQLPDHCDDQKQRQLDMKRVRSPQAIVCSCQTQPCLIHPVVIKVRKRQRSSPFYCKCPPESKPYIHTHRPAGPRHSRRCECTEQPCRHGTGVSYNWRRRGTPQGPSVLFANLQQQQQILTPPCPHGSAKICDCPSEARLCMYPVSSQYQRHQQQCQDRGQVIPTMTIAASDGPIKKVKCRVRRAADCAMARCSAELAMLQLHWELPSECAPCRPRRLTRRLCRRQYSDNELYRSNSFKFEKFERSKDDCSTPMRKQRILDTG